MPRRLAIGLLVLALASIARGSQPPADEPICDSIFSYARAHGLAARPIAEITAEVATRFLGSPYEAGTLDRGVREEVVTDLRTFDCVTLVENVVALARCIRRGTLTFTAYRAELEAIRYRGGACRGYESRLHYFSEWIADGQAKGIVRDITRELGGRRVTTRIDFMTSHRNLYPRMVADSAIRAAERRLSRTPRYVLRRAGAGTRIPPGAIVALAASVPGLDVTHTGIAVRGDDGLIHLLHAPDAGDSVRITAQPLAEYARKSAGLVIALPLDPP